jgi:hypothetical protein
VEPNAVMAGGSIAEVIESKALGFEGRGHSIILIPKLMVGVYRILCCAVIVSKNLSTFRSSVT